MDRLSPIPRRAQTGAQRRPAPCRSSGGRTPALAAVRNGDRVKQAIPYTT
ncbi:hypothetical protein ACFOPN_05095 [Xanthomonas hyacinthi]|nr:hypothetical protein [Xanthomonas hyacinthi]